MASAYFEPLPAEIWVRIGELSALDGLKALALVSKQCYSAAVAQLYRNVTVNLSELGNYQLSHGISCSSHVRQLSVFDKLPFARADNDNTWTLFIAFIRALPSLADLVWLCSASPSDRVLQALQQHLPSCGLHLRKFRLSCPSKPGLGEADVAIATSPNLRSIWFQYDNCLGNGEPSHIHAAVRRITRGLAPNLSQVRATRTSRASNPELEVPWVTLEQSERRVEGGLRIARGALRELELSAISSRQLNEWAESTNFNQLHHLTLDCVLDLYVLQALLDYNFGALKSLSIMLTPAHHDMLANFFGRLPPLSSLRLDGSVRVTTLASIIAPHSATLTTLHLRGFRTEKRRWPLDAEDLKATLSSCTALRDLTVSLQRTRGNAHEVAAYKFLGSLPRLQKLHLHLEASDFEVLGGALLIGDDDAYESPTDPSFDEFEQQFFDEQFGVWPRPRNGHIRDAFINSAVDKALALCIFRTINAAKPAGAKQLEDLEVVPTGGGNFGIGIAPNSFANVVYHIGRQWRVRRSLGGQLVAEETERPRNTRAQQDKLGHDVGPIFRRLWPVKNGGSGDWRDDWHSWPLQV